MNRNTVKFRNKSRGLYFLRPFLRGLFLEGFIFGGKSIGLACSGKKIYYFCFVLLCIRGQIPKTILRGAYIQRGDLTEGFLRYDFVGLIFGGAYFRNFTVYEMTQIFKNIELMNECILKFYRFIQTWDFAARFSVCTWFGSFDVTGLSRLLLDSPFLSNSSFCFVCVDLSSSSEISFLSRNLSLTLLLLSLLSVSVHFFSLWVCTLLPHSSVYRLRRSLFSLFPWCLLCLYSFSGASRGILLLGLCWITC